eukprot:1194099-Prorocentrum_minimum.AAC.4
MQQSGEKPPLPASDWSIGRTLKHASCELAHCMLSNAHMRCPLPTRDVMSGRTETHQGYTHSIGTSCGRSLGNSTSCYGSSCANNGEGAALNTPETLPGRHFR